MKSLPLKAAAMMLATITAAQLPQSAIADDNRWSRAEQGRSWRGQDWQWRGDGRRFNRINVTGGQYPRLNQAIAHELGNLLGRRSGPVHVHLRRVDIDPRVRSRRTERVREPLGRGYDRRCGPQTLVYDVRRGTVRTRYSVRYTIEGARFAPQRERARGRVSVPFDQIGAAAIHSRCGREQLGPRQLRRLTGISGKQQAQRPLSALRGPLAYDIARDIANDLRHVNSRRYDRRQRY